MAKSELYNTVYGYHPSYGYDPYPYTIAKGLYQVAEPEWYSYKEINMADYQKLFGPQGITLELKSGGNSMANPVHYSDIAEGDVINVVFEKQTVSKVTTENGETLIETRSGRTVYGTTNGNAPTRFEMVTKAVKKPKSWPPKQDDVWVGTDSYGFVTHYHVNSAKKFHLSSFSASYTPEEILGNHQDGGKLELAFRK